MPCFTRVVIVEDTEINKKAREALGLPLEGPLTASEARKVKVEAGVIKTKQAMRRLNPSAVIRRTPLATGSSVMILQSPACPVLLR